MDDRALGAGRSRRGLLAGLLAAFGLAEAVDAKPGAEGNGGGRDGGESHGRNRGNGHGNGRNRKGKRCDPKPDAEVCDGKCGPQKNNCGKWVNCEPCACATAAECPDVACRDKACDAGFCVYSDGPDGACCDGGAGNCLAGECEPCGECESCGTAYCVGSDATDGDACGGPGDVCFDGSCCTPDDDGDTCAGRCGTVENNCGEPVDCTPLCGGCCDDGDLCQAGGSDGVCGAGGAACAACPAPQVCGGPGCGCVRDPATCVLNQAFCPGGDCGKCCGRLSFPCDPTTDCCLRPLPGDACAEDANCQGSADGRAVCRCKTCCVVAGKQVFGHLSTCANCCSGACEADGVTCAADPA